MINALTQHQGTTSSIPFTTLNCIVAFWLNWEALTPTIRKEISHYLCRFQNKIFYNKNLFVVRSAPWVFMCSFLCPIQTATFLSWEKTVGMTWHLCVADKNTLVYESHSQTCVVQRRIARLIFVFSMPICCTIPTNTWGTIKWSLSEPQWQWHAVISLRGCSWVIT